MLAWADNEFNLSAKDKDGATLRQHLEMAFKATGERPRELIPLPFPDALRYVWEWFVELSQGRQFNEGGALPFSYPDILAWSLLSGNSISAEELNIIKKLDILFLKDRKK